MITEIILLLCIIAVCLASYNLYKTLRNEAEIKAKEVEEGIKNGDGGMTEKGFTDIGPGFKMLAKAFQDMGNANKKVHQTLAKMVLSKPIPMNYETWSFLHEIADGDE